MAAPAAMNAAEHGSAPAQLPIVNGRKTLIIGLGSTGTQVCNQILERLMWTYGTPDNIPWIRCLTLETAGVPANRPVLMHAKHLHLTVPPAEYQSLLSNPGAYQETLAFSNWNIPELTGASDRITDGANNTRILGRLALLFPHNFNAVSAAVLELLKEVNQLTETEAARRYKNANDETVQVSIGQNIHLYVVGTLCGGTASGCFIDLAYLIKHLQNNLNLTGIFTIPSDAEHNAILLGNATAALVELNHFSTDHTRYEAQFPDQPGRPYRTAANGERPYQNLYLAQPRGASERERNQLTTTVADYIYADAIGTTAAERDARRTNIANLFNTPDRWGATQKYFTFGMSEIEFPYIKVVKACSARLARIGFENLLGTPGLTQNALNNEMEAIPLRMRQKLTERLLVYPPDGLRKRIDAVIVDAVGKAAHSDEPLDIVRSQLRGAFDGECPAPHPSLPLRIVPNTIEDNMKGAREELMDSLRRVVSGFLTGSDPKGIQPLLELLNTLDNDWAPKSSGGGEASVSELEEDINAAQGHIAECRHDFWLKAVGQRAGAVSRYLGEFEEAAKTYYQRRLTNACAPACDSIHAEARLFVQALKHRLVNTPAPRAAFASGVVTHDVCLRSEVEKVISGLTLLEQHLNVAYGGGDAWSRTINGTELFDSATTVNQEYYSCVGANERSLAIKAVAPYFRSALIQLFTDSNRRSRLDADPNNQPPDLSETRLLGLAQEARKTFAAINETSIIDRLLARNDVDTILQGAQTASDLFLDWKANSPRHYEQENKTYRMVFYNPQSPRAEEFKQHLAAARILPATKDPDAIPDRHQLVILQERGAFSLGTIGALDDLQDSRWLSSYRHPQASPARPNARGDIQEWVTWAKADDDQLKRLRALFLVGCALHKPNSDTGIIEFRSATEYQFRYPPRDGTDTGVLTLSDDLIKSARLLKTKDMEAELKARIRTHRTTYGVTEMIGQIDDLIKKPQQMFCEGDVRLSPEALMRILEEYVQSDQDLKTAYEQIYPSVDNHYRHVDPVTNKVTFQCPHCKADLGESSDALYITEDVNGVRTRQRKCNYCREAIA